MCDPISAIAVGSLAISATGSVVQHKAQNRQRKEALRANAQLQADTAASAQAEYDHGINTLAVRERQERTAAEDVIAQNQVTARRSILASTRAAALADGQARVSAGAAGVAGASVDALLTDIVRTDAGNELSVNADLTRATANIRTNLQMTEEQRQLERQSLGIQKQNRINGVANLQAPPGANPLATALQIGGDVLGFANHLQSRKPK